VEVGELVSLHASVNYVGRSSMIVGIRVEAEHVKNSTVRHTNSCYFTMVAKDDHDKPAEVPKLILETHNDVRRFIEAMHMKEIKSRINEQLDDVKSTLHVNEAMELLKKERCIIAFKDDE